LIWFRKKLVSVIWDKSKVVEGIQGINVCRIWQCIVAIVDKPSCSIVVEIIRNIIEKILISGKFVVITRERRGLTVSILATNA
jgi:hypothetical protein